MRRQKAGQTRWRQVQSQVETQEGALVALFGVPVRDIDRLNRGHRLGKKDQQLLNAGVIGQRHLPDTDQVGEQDRQGRVYPIQELHFPTAGLPCSSTCRTAVSFFCTPG